jgi:hypothetical protein
LSIEHIEFIVEEPSMEAALRALLPKVLGELSFAVYPHQCKEELFLRLLERLRGYANWLPETWRIVVVVDRDDDDCVKLKKKMERVAKQAGLITRSAASGRRYVVINRMAVEELEAWYFGDWKAVKSAYPKVSARIPEKAGFRDPDAISGGTWEAFERLLQLAGYFTGGLRKIEAAHSIAPRMDPMNNRSRSFQVFRDSLRSLLP